MSKQNISQPLFVTLIFIGAVPLSVFLGLMCLAVSPEQHVQAQTYNLPNDNASCPGKCRVIPWKTGADLWSNGTLPTYSPVICTGLAANGTTNDGPAIQTCINNAALNTAVFIPAGTYLINSTLRLKSDVVLRGAGTPSTFLNLGSSGTLTTGEFSTATNLTPATV